MRSSLPSGDNIGRIEEDRLLPIRAEPVASESSQKA